MWHQKVFAQNAIVSLEPLSIILREELGFLNSDSLLKGSWLECADISKQLGGLQKSGEKVRL